MDSKLGLRVVLYFFTILTILGIYTITMTRGGNRIMISRTPPKNEQYHPLSEIWINPAYPINWKGVSFENISSIEANTVKTNTINTNTIYSHIIYQNGKQVIDTINAGQGISVSKIGDTVIIKNTGDISPTNELQTLYRSGNKICISKINSIEGSCVIDEKGVSGCHLECVYVNKSVNQYTISSCDSSKCKTSVHVACPPGYKAMGCGGYIDCMRSGSEYLKIYSIYEENNGCTAFGYCYSSIDPYKGYPAYINAQAICCKIVCS